jgi:hypothetical protein
VRQSEAGKKVFLFFVIDKTGPKDDGVDWMWCFADVISWA